MIFEAGQTIRFRGKQGEARAAQAVKAAPDCVERIGKTVIRLLVRGQLVLADPPKRRVPFGSGIAFTHSE
jgi:hypothetical protein